MFSVNLIFRNRNYRLLWLAQVISGIGDVLYTVAIVVTIFQQSGSALMTAGVTVALSLPPFLVGPFAGAIVDGHSRRSVLIVMDLVRAGLVGLILLLGQQGDLNVWLGYLVVAGIATATAFYDPARLALIPSLVERHELVQANSIMIGTKQATMAAGYILGGILILVIPFNTIVSIDLVTFLMAALLVMLVRPAAKADALENVAMRIPLWRAIREGLSYLREHQIARPLVVMEVFEHAPHGVWTVALMLVFVERALGGNATDWGYQNAAFFSGMFTGAVIASSAATLLNRAAGWVIVVNAFLSALLTFIYASSPTNLIAVLLAFSFGPPMALRDVAQDTLLQVTVEDRMRGRVYALRNMLRNVVFMIAGLGFAWLADFVDVRQIYMVAGVLYAGTGLYALLNRPLRQSKLLAIAEPVAEYTSV